MSEVKFTRRQATVAEIESIGFAVENGMAKSPKTGAWYAIDNFLVGNSATIDGERKFGAFLYLDDDLPAAERVLVDISARGNRECLNLYLVSEGDVAPATVETEWDGENSILVAATSEQGALKVADAYDRGIVQADNLEWCGKTIAVVTLRDSDTGLYA